MAIEAFFNAMSQAEVDHTFAIRLVLEANENIRDPLASPAPGEKPPRPPAARGPEEWHPVCGLSEHEPSRADEVFEMLECGNAPRRLGDVGEPALCGRTRCSRSALPRASGIEDEHQLGSYARRPRRRSAARSAQQGHHLGGRYH